jgi:hypothetical protein
MTASALRYEASREWMEDQILAGRPIGDRRQSLSVDLAEAPLEHLGRLEAVLDGVVFIPTLERFAVLDSGLDPEVRYGSSEEELDAMDAPVIAALGAMPELPEPTTELAAVLDAWEQWLERYRMESLARIESYIAESPAVAENSGRFGAKGWGPITVTFGAGIAMTIEPEHGAPAMRDALAGWMWARAANTAFGAESVAAAKEATAATSDQAREWIADDPAQVASRFHQRVKRLYVAAKAHCVARSARVPDFEAEMHRWAEERGSERLRLGLSDGYRMNSRYLAERLAKEAPGFYAMPTQLASEGWATKASSPSEPALRLRRAVAASVATAAPQNFDGPPPVEIMNVAKPPHQMYWAEGGAGPYADYPDTAAWPWEVDLEGELFGADAIPFEAVVVSNWLGRFHLIGAVAPDSETPVAGIWAVPNPDHYHSDGGIEAADPDEPTRAKAKRKPPGPSPVDDIPF